MPDIHYNVSNSRRLARSARAVIPGGVNSNFRKDSAFQPLFFSHGKGGRLYDVDGNEYIDLALSFGPAILGHDNQHLREALIDQAGRLYTPQSTELEQRAAEKIRTHVACAELVRFATTGTEANYNALRIARAFTERNLILRFSGNYHGGTDELLGGINNYPTDPTVSAGEFDDDMFSQMTNTRGRGTSSLASTLMLEWNDLGAAQRLFERLGEQIAAVLLEPVMLNSSGCMPEPGYLEGIRALCTKHGAVLIFDEVLTGFRIALGGAQAHFGVTPDMAVFAKAIGGGFPVSAFCGRREIMELVSNADVVAGGTYNGHPLAMAAVIATIEELERNNGQAYRHIAAMGNRLREGLLESARRHGQNLLLQGFPGAWVHSFSHREHISNHVQSRGFGGFKVAEFNGLLKSRGVIATSRLCVSAAHTEKDIDEALMRADEVLQIMP